MKLSLNQQQQFNDQGWQWAIKTGRETLGNLQVNLRFLDKTGLLHPRLKALEVGCGTATLTEQLYRQGLDIHACDISQVAIDRASQKYPHLALSVQTAEQLPFDDGQFDLVLSFDVMEHLFEPDRHLSEVRRVLKPGGYYLLETPNKWLNQLYETVSTKSFNWKQYHPSLHSARQLRQRLAQHGFDVRFIKMNPSSEFTLKKLQRFRLLQMIFGRMPFESLPLWMQTNFYVIARKTAGQ